MQSPHRTEDAETETKKTKDKKIPNNKEKLEDTQRIKIIKMNDKNSDQVTSDYYFG